MWECTKIILFQKNVLNLIRNKLCIWNIYPESIMTLSNGWFLHVVFFFFFTNNLNPVHGEEEESFVPCSHLHI